MMEMAETASITTPSLKRSSLSEASTVSDASSTGSGSRERLLAGVSVILQEQTFDLMLQCFILSLLNRIGLNPPGY